MVDVKISHKVFPLRRQFDTKENSAIIRLKLAPIRQLFHNFIDISLTANEVKRNMSSIK